MRYRGKFRALTWRQSRGTRKGIAASRLRVPGFPLVDVAFPKIKPNEGGKYWKGRLTKTYRCTLYISVRQRFLLMKIYFRPFALHLIRRVRVFVVVVVVVAGRESIAVTAFDRNTLSSIISGSIDGLPLFTRRTWIIRRVSARSANSTGHEQ